MIRQHFYPKSYFRHRVLSKSNNKIIQLLHQNEEGIQCRKQKVHKSKYAQNIFPIQQIDNKKDICMIEGVLTQNSQKSKYAQPQNSFQELFNPSLNQLYCKKSQCKTLKQNHNRLNIQIQQKLAKHFDIQKLFIKSQKKQIFKSHKNMYKIGQINNGNNQRIVNTHHSCRIQPKYKNNENQSFCLDNSYRICKKQSFSGTYRKLHTADSSKNSFRRSIQRKKKSIITPSQIIVDSISTIQGKQGINKEKLLKQEKKKQIQFERMTNNLINLNFSKAIKYRKSGKQQKTKLNQSRKNSQNLMTQNLLQRKQELQQRVKGWQIQIDDDIDMDTN